MKSEPLRPRRRTLRLFGRGRNRRVGRPTWQPALAVDSPPPATAAEACEAATVRQRARGRRAAAGTWTWLRDHGLGALGRTLLGALVLLLKTLTLLALLGGAALGGWTGYQKLMRSDHLTLREVRVEGARRADANEIKLLVRSCLGRKIFALDMAEVERSVEAHPWVVRARAHRELPGTLAIEVEEQVPRALLLLGNLYLVNGDGQVFKRADPEETAGLPVITGIGRLDYLNHPECGRPLLSRALWALRQYDGKNRPALSEINVGERGEVTLFLKHGGAALRFGRTMDELRLSRLDAVLAALGPETARMRAVYLDNETRMNRVTVRMGSF